MKNSNKNVNSFSVKIRSIQIQKLKNIGLLKKISISIIFCNFLIIPNSKFLMQIISCENRNCAYLIYTVPIFNID